MTTQSARAADAYVEGVDRLLSVQPGADRCFQTAIDADPGFALAHIALARTQQLRLQPVEARATAARARALLPGVTPREQGHVETIARAIDGDSAGALEAVKAHCATHRRDALVLQLNFGAFGLISFAGRREHDEDMYTFLRQFVGDLGDDWWFRFAWAWAHTESGRVAEGRRLMDQAFALNPRNANAVHGLAHVFYEEGDPAGGVKFVEGWRPGYDRAGSLHCHLTWHTALFELVRGDVARARVAFEDGIRARVAPMAPATNVLTDGVSLLWRFMLDGEPVSAEDWKEIASYAQARFPSTTAHFHELHWPDGVGDHRRMGSLRATPGGAPRAGREGDAAARRRRARARRGLRRVRPRRLRGGSARDRAVRRRHRALRRQPRAAGRVGGDAHRRVDPRRRAREGAARARASPGAPSVAARGAVAG